MQLMSTGFPIFPLSISAGHKETCSNFAQKVILKLICTSQKGTDNPVQKNPFCLERVGRYPHPASGRFFGFGSFCRLGMPQGTPRENSAGSNKHDQQRKELYVNGRSYKCTYIFVGVDSLRVPPVATLALLLY